MGLSYEGHLLISRPELADPNFDRTVTFLIEHNEDGALGVVLNRPSKLTVGEPFPDWEDLASGPDVVFSGGPVQRNALIALGRGTDEGDLPCGLHSVDLDSDAVLVGAEGIVEIRVFAGYAGWGTGQLEGEIANDAWWLVPASTVDVFCDRPERLWADVLRRSGGDLAWFAHFPADASLN